MGGKENIKIYTIGDSHAWHCWLNVPNVVTKTRGAMLMYTLGMSTKPMLLEDIPKDDIICFCWGEIDCRCHVHKHLPYKECIDRLVENYVKAIKMNTVDRPHVWVFNVVPPPRKGKVAAENQAFPFLGSDEERLLYVQYMNEKLREAPFVFVDVYGKYCDKDGFLNMTMSDGHVHIADPKPLTEWVNNKLKDYQ